jgi:hypothetical protein
MRRSIPAASVVLLGLIGTFSPAAGTEPAASKNDKPAVTSSQTPSTRLYVRTVPPGAEIKLDGKPSGRSDHLFVVPPGVSKMTVVVALDGYESEQKEVEIRGGRITRVVLELDALPSSEHGSQVASSRPPNKIASMAIPKNVAILSHVGDAPGDKGDVRSLAGSGHAIRFERSDAAKYLCAVQIFAGRYGLPTPPDEDFHVYLLDENMKILKDFPYPYGTIPRKGGLRWHTLPIPPTETPKRFFIALSFNPHETKGIYLGIDKSVKEVHSYTGLPGEGYEKVTDGYDWMVRACLVPKAELPAEENPFADQFTE